MSVFAFNSYQTRRGLSVAATVMALLCTLLAIGIGPVNQQLANTLPGRTTQHTAAAQFFDPIDDPVRYTMCFFGEDTIVAKLYQWSQTTEDEFEWRSKSALTSGVASVDHSLFNQALAIFGYDFGETNRRLLGRNLSSWYRNPTPVDGFKKENFNQGPRVSPYDRFGVEGLKFTSYVGEWKHIVVNACDPKAKPADPMEGMYYEGRLAPHSPWDDRKRSQDVRTIQFNKSFPAQVHLALTQLLANSVFAVAKGVVTLTITVIGYAYSDMVKITGWAELLAGETGHTGIWQWLYESVWAPFSLLALVFSFCWYGALMLTRSLTLGLKELGVKFLWWLTMLASSIAPENTVLLPGRMVNMITTTALVGLMEQFSPDLQLCETNIAAGRIHKGDANEEAREFQRQTTQEEQEASKLETHALNMRNTVSCLYWQNLLFRPWVVGQFGTDYTNLWVQGKKPEWATNGINVTNTNGEWVGDAGVPLGNGEWIHNWAIYQLSTGTNAHAQTGKDGHFPAYASGIAKDWWRIVDAMANYNEGKNQATINVNGNPVSLDYNEPLPPAPLSTWDHWVGNSGFSRFWTALGATFIAIAVTITPAVLAIGSSVYQIMMALTVAIAPLIFAFGMFPFARSNDIVIGWAQLLLNTASKRLAYAILLTLTVFFTVQFTTLMYQGSAGWWETMFRLIVLAIVILYVKEPLAYMAAQARFAKIQIDGKVADMLSGHAINVRRARRNVTNNLAVKPMAQKVGMTEEEVTHWIEDREYHIRAREDANRMNRIKDASRIEHYSSFMHSPDRSSTIMRIPHNLLLRQRCNNCDTQFTKTTVIYFRLIRSLADSKNGLNYTRLWCEGCWNKNVVPGSTKKGGGVYIHPMALRLPICIERLDDGRLRVINQLSPEQVKLFEQRRKEALLNQQKEEERREADSKKPPKRKKPNDS